MIGLGGALGSVARYWLAVVVASEFGADFPYGTLVINVLGSFVIGAVAALPGGELSRAFLMVGVCGGFTTFSAFSLQTLLLARGGQTGAALANVGLSVGACLLAVTLGVGLVERMAATTR